MTEPAKAVVVTGGSRGIGLGIVAELVESGYHPIIISRSIHDETMEIISAARCSSVLWDLSKTETFAELAQHIRGSFATIYGLINNAGIGTSGILATMREDKIAELLNLNVLSPIVLTKHLIRPMLVARQGRIINMSSIVASTGYPGLSAYSASKAAMIGFTKSLAREVGSVGITVNAIAPGFIDTNMTNELNEKQREQIKRRSALQRMATVEDIANAVKYLLSDKAQNITGTVLTVDAGNTA
jgi:3-oxoacyl-[acyl-carrier protein] reductase